MLTQPQNDQAEEENLSRDVFCTPPVSDFVVCGWLPSLTHADRRTTEQDCILMVAVYLFRAQVAEAAPTRTGRAIQFVLCG